MKKKVTVLATTAILSTAFAAHASASTYVVKKGDTLSSIASKYKTTVKELKSINNLSSDLIRINQNLTISTSTSTNTSKATQNSSTTQNSTTKTYKVVAGDSLIKIANQFSITLGELKQWNNLTSNSIYPGNVFYVSKPNSSTNNTTTSNSSESNSSNNSSSSNKSTTSKTETYTIKSGDTLGKIASQYSLSVANLKQLNNLTSDLIFPGQKLKVTASQASEKGTNTNNNAGSNISNNNSSSNKSTSSNTETYTIKSGDTLGKIASQYSLSVAKLKQLNNLTSDVIFPGQKLKVTASQASEKVTNTNNNAGGTSSKPELISTGNSGSFTSNIVSISKQFIGVPYEWGGATPTGFDCSGFVYYVLNQSGKSIARYSAEGYYNRSYYVDVPAVGDIVYFKNTYKEGISHLGIYIGNNQFIHADSSGVRITSLDNSYYKQHFDSFKRLY